MQVHIGRLILVFGLVLTWNLGDASALAQPASESRSFSGTLENGTTWIAEVPEPWNGTLLLYSHGYLPSFAGAPNTPALAPDPATLEALLAEGYALAGSSYAAAGWALSTAVDDQFNTLTEVLQRLDQPPVHVLAYGSSMGGLVTAKLAEVGGDVIDGALPTCGIVGGGLALVNYQLDGGHALNQLLAPTQDLQLQGFAGVEDAFAASATMVAAVEAAQTSAEGRARIALVAALYQLPSWTVGEEKPDPGDWNGIQEGQYRWLVETLPFVVPGRVDLEAAVAGNASGNIGVDYADLLRHSGDRDTVRALYHAADLDLRADLAQLTDQADIAPEPAAVANMCETSVPSGVLQVPVLSIHTTHDNLVPVQHELSYGQRAARQRSAALLRQSFVDRPGHCAFTPAELVAGIHALEHRVATGCWHRATTQTLQREAETLDLGAAAFVNYVFEGSLLGDEPERACGMSAP